MGSDVRLERDRRATGERILLAPFQAKNKILKQNKKKNYQKNETN